MSSNLLHLASRSPRRADLLRLLGVDFVVLDIDVDESRHFHEPAVDYVQRVAKRKADAGYLAIGAGNVVLAADTAVSIDSEIFGKPRDAEHAAAMLRRLAGRWHAVHSAVVVFDKSGTAHVRVAGAQVKFTPINETAINAYWHSGEPRGKAGGYAIQGLGGAFVERIEGSPSAVIGLPLAETRALLDGVGITHALSGR